MSNNTRDAFVAVVIALAVIAVIAVLAVNIKDGAAKGHDAAQRMLETCVSSGGSWIEWEAICIQGGPR